ncbi:uncharacterized protein MONOS_12261 [Monocercomonoides exilis]|uniref:uncharacterized protein n=1 Tax=Monocercomonoides exilis TaxID=2049356 RepID=UPI0035597261|nr:hypothetical protein MONOS_12261 [Monocercomonoides exilis]
MCIANDTEITRGGGIFCAGSSLTLSVVNCSFFICMASIDGGAIYVANSNLKSILNCYFENNTANYGGGTYFTSMTDKVIIEKCTYIGNVALSCGHDIRFFQMQSLINNAIMESCLFIGWNTSTNGSNYFDPAPKNLYFSNCYWSDFHSNLGSAALFMDCHESWASTPPRFLFLFFHNNTSGGNHGHDYWLNSSFNILNPFAYSFSTTPAKRVNFMGTSESKEFNSWIPQGTMIYSKTGGADTEGCGLSALSTPCNSLEYILSRLQELRTGLVSMLQAKFQPATLNIGEMTVTMKGDGKDATVISTSQVPQSASSVIVLSSGSLCLTNVTVDTLPLIAFQAPDQLGMKNVLMESISRKSGNGGIMEMEVEEQEIVSFDNVTFRNCSCQQGNGGAMFVALKTNSMFTVGQDVAVNFNECCVPTDDQSKGKGGALYIKVCSDEPLFILNALSFERCNAWKGKNVFVEAVNLGTCVNENTIKFGRNGMLDDDLMGFENNDPSHLIPLRLYLSGAFVPPVHVGGPNNRDFSGCGYVSYPCSTLKHAVSLRFSDADRLLSLHSQFVWNEEMTLDGFAWNICCEQENTSISFKPVAPVEGDGFITCASSSLFQNICFMLCDQQEFSFRSLLVGLGPSLSISDCSLKMEIDDSVLTNSFAEIRKGTFSISNFHIQQLTADLSFPAPSGLICVSGDETSIDAKGLICKQLTVRNKGDFFCLSSGKSSEIKNSVFEEGSYADGCCVQWTNGQSLKVRNTSFASEIRTSGNGSCINVKGISENFKSMMITNCSFDSCSVQEDESCGGAICGTEDAKCGLTVSECTFHSCTAPEGLLGKGYGGGICLYCSSDSDDLFSIASPVSSLEHPNSAAIGKDLFIQSPNLTNTLTNKTLPFVAGSADLTDDSMRGYDGADKVHAIPLVYFYRVITNEVCASETGQDVAPCGFDTYPCRSISFSFKRQNGSKSNVILSPLFTLAESVVADGEKTHTIGGVAERSVVIVQGAKSPEAGLFCSSISLGFSVIINSIAFKLPTAIQAHSSLMHHKGSGSTRVENCEFEPQEAVESHSFSLIAAESGDITISDCSFKNIAYVAACIVSCSGSSQTLIDKATITNATTLTGSSLIAATTSTAELTVRDSSFTSVAKSNCVAIQTAFIQALTLNNTNIENIERSSNNGGAVECTVGNGGSVVIEGGSMKKCVCEGWNGGGLHISVEAGGNVQVGNTSSAETAIEECSSKENGGKGGYGGGIMLLLSEGAQNVIIKNVLFTLCSAPKGGSNIFMEAPVLENVAKATVLAHSFNTSVEDMPVFEELGGFDGSNKRDVIPLVLFFRQLSSTAHVSGTGIDYYKCGYADFPCLTIPFSESLIKESSGVILVESSFNIKDKIELKTKNMSIKAKESRSEIRVDAGGGGSSGGMIETSKEVNIEQISFVHPSSLGEAISFLFMCLNERLCISDCQVEMEAASGLTCSFSLIGVLGGELKCEHFSVLNSRYGSVEMIVLDGSGTNNAVKCNMNDANFTDIATRSEKGMMSVKSVQEFGMENSKVQNTNQMNYPFFSFEGTANITMKNSTFSEISRQNGFGGLMNGRVNEKEKIEITNCTMDICNSTSEDMCGGCVHVDVGDYGTFLFDGNTATKCKVFGERSFGGGLYIILNTLKSKYSLKMIEFSENEAKRGKNIYIVCPTPREVIKPTLFDKSADENMEEEELWVYDTSGSMPDGESLRRYLFASDAEIVFLDSTNGTDSPECGTDLYPCQTMDAGFTKMTDNQSTLHIQGSTELNRDVNRAGKSLTVRGKAEHSTLNIETNGHFWLSEGSETPSLIFNNIRFALLAQSGRSELINAQTGTLFLKNCIFDESERSDTKIEFWLLECRRAEASFTTVIINTLSFTESVGIARVTEGIIEMEDVNISDASSKGNGLIQGCEGSDLLLRNIRAESCVVENGQVVSVSGKASLSITKNSKFGTCENLNGNGGAVSVKGCTNEEFIFANISLQSCTVDEMEMKGGGFFFEFTEQHSRTFSVMDCSFGNNKAKFGKDAFISCFDLNNSVTSERFARLSGDGENGTVEMMGTDNVNFKNENVNLMLFLVQGKFEVVKVSPTGLDVLGCGSSEHPCQSLWRGFQNLVPETREREIRINGSAMVNDSYDLYSFLTISSSTDKTAELFINPKIERGEETSVFSSTMSLTLHSISLLMPQAFENGQTIVFESSSPSGMLDFQSSSFNVEREGEIAYQLVHVTSGSLSLFNCSVSIFRFFQTPFVACGSVQLSNCNISKVCTSGSVEGGALCVCLTNSNNAAINETTACKCVCEAKEGMGGFMFLNSTDSLEEKPLSIISSVFEANEAALGKNIFMQASDLNTTVTEDVFAFDYEQLKDNPDLFVGSDRFQNNVDLFVFLISFKSDTVFVSSSGFDVKRCGSEFIACRSFWKGFGQIDQTKQEKIILIDQAAAVTDQYDVSNFTIKSSVKMALEEASSLLFETANESNEICFFSNAHKLSVVDLALKMRKVEEGSSVRVIKNIQGILSLEDCSFETSADSAGASFRADVLFAMMSSGEFFVKKLKVKASVRKDLFCINSGCLCNFDGMDVKELSSDCGCVVNVEQQERNTNAEQAHISMDGSLFSSVVRSDDGSCVVKSSSNVPLSLDINGSTFEFCRSPESEKGGAIFVNLASDGVFKLSSSNVVQCGCSSSAGRGGGVYLCAKEEGSLKFVFKNSSFDSNSAKTGKDIFIECRDISAQVNESQFAMDLREGYYNRVNAIWGIDDKHQSEIDLMDFIVVYQSSMIFVSSANNKNGENSRKCGTTKVPCLSLGYGLSHVVTDDVPMLVIDTECVLQEEVDLTDVSMRPRSYEGGRIVLVGGIAPTRNSLMRAWERVKIEMLNITLPFSDSFAHLCLLEISSGYFEMSRSVVSTSDELNRAKAECVFLCSDGECVLFDVTVSLLDCSCVAACSGGALNCSSLLLASLDVSQNCLQISGSSGNCTLANISARDIQLDDGYVIAVSSQFHQQNSIATEFRKHLSMFLGSFSAITGKSDYSGVIYVEGSSHQIEMNSLSVENMSSKANIGSYASFSHCSDISIESCLFNGDKSLRNSNVSMNEKTNICKWNGSLVDFSDCTAKFKDSAFANSSEGGLSVSGGNVEIEKGEFANNNPSIGKYPSARRNILCSDSAQLNIMSLKGGDGVKDDSSMWILNDGCSLMGIVEERASPLFVPTLRRVETEEKEEVLDVVFRGALLLPCNLSFRVVSSVGDVEQMETHEISESGFVSEEEVRGTTGLEMVRGAEASAEVRVCILFGDGHSPSATESFILKNRSEVESKGDERIAEGGKEGKSIWPIIVVILTVLFLIVLIGFIMFVIRWRKVKNEAEDLREIVNDNIRKDPKAFEMVTMEMSPEEQWRRAEREAEKKNEERMKKRVYGKQMQHSESSEHLLSESGSTEYILGRDSDKIPQWALEKVDEKEEEEEEEEEETRKRTPSPSISSTSTADSDSTFVRVESLCPTTSSMSNLVDAMACSSPHEKLIVDLRDSLFMLLHGRNKTKEMAIGTLQEREQTAAQILFWVANGALHSFDEMENPLQSLSNLSPHIVLFSEHMVICIVMHSDLLSDDDSDSSSISSSTVVTSASDNDDNEDSLPSSAFEDEDDFKKECLRWKAPELLINKKMGATKESVAFSIGMMLWECLTLQIPFGDYEAEVAGQKIVNGERPALGSAERSSFCSVVENCLNSLSQKRPSLATLKRELFLHFPLGAMVLTASDAIDRTTDSQQSGRGASSELACSESEMLGNRN